MCRDEQFQGTDAYGTRLLEMLTDGPPLAVQVVLDRADPEGAGYDIVGEFMHCERVRRSTLFWRKPVMHVIEANKKHQTELPSVLEVGLTETGIIAPLRDLILKHLLPKRCFAAPAAAAVAAALPSPPTP